jgi:hypothetical protein
MSDIEGSEPDWQLAARVAASECGAASEFQRRSMKEKNLLRVERKIGSTSLPSLFSVECSGAALPFLVSEETAPADDLGN